MVRCKHMDKECDKRVINDKQCNKCLFEAQAEMINTLNARITELENKGKKTPRKTGRSPKAKMIG